MKHASIQTILIKDLTTFIDDFLKASPKQTCIPISRRRAYSQAKNPNANPNDIALFVAYVGSVCVGYLGVMPGVLRRENTLSKVHFSTTAYVPPEHIRSGAGIYLARALSYIDGDLVGCDNRPKAERLWRGFDRVEEIGFRKFSIPTNYFEKLKGCNPTFLEQYYLSPIKPKNIPSSDTWPNSKYPIEFYRSPETIQWIVENSWLSETSESILEEEHSYYFAHPDMKIEYFPICVYSSDKKSVIGFQLLSLVSQKNGIRKIKILDSHVSPNRERFPSIPIAYAYAKEFSASHIELSQETLALAETEFLLVSMGFSQRRSYFLRPRDSKSPLHGVSTKIQLHLEDGDTSFT